MDKEIKFYKSDIWLAAIIIVVIFIYTFGESMLKTHEIFTYKKYLIEKGYGYYTNDVYGQSTLILK